MGHLRQIEASYKAPTPSLKPMGQRCDGTSHVASTSETHRAKLLPLLLVTDIQIENNHNLKLGSLYNLNV
ncbi:hypothetical protein ACE6H2_020642 [Prunus campanulata]